MMVLGGRCFMIVGSFLVTFSCVDVMMLVCR
jgi:hypothetical protein